MKDTKGERQEIYKIQAEIKHILLHRWNEKIKIPNKIFLINNKIKVTYYWIIKVTWFYLRILNKIHFCNIFS